MSGGKFVLANLIPTQAQRQQAGAFALLMICGCVLTLPFAGVHFPRFDALALASDSALATLGFIVATLLYAQFAVTRKPSLLVLACGFLLLALATVPQLLREVAGVPLDHRLQFIADLSLPLAAIAYSLVHSAVPDRLLDRGAGAYLFGGLAATAAVAALATWITTSDLDAALSDGTATAWRVLTTAVLVVLFGLAIAPLWRRRASVLDLWLLVALTAWLIDVLLRGLAMDDSTFTWHVARLYGLLGTACMVLALLTENAVVNSRVTRLLAIRGALHGKRGHARPSQAKDVGLEALSNELNQPLCAITANADAIGRLLDRDPADLREVRAALSDIVADAGRASEALRSAWQPRLDVIDVNQLVDECVQQLRAELSSLRIACEVQTAEALPGILGARNELLQLLVNLVRHSLDAMARVERREHWLRVSARAHDQGVAICVEDSGEGIPSRSESRLALFHDLVSAQGGRFTMMACAGGGASFKVILPGS